MLIREEPVDDLSAAVDLERARARSQTELRAGRSRPDALAQRAGCARVDAMSERLSGTIVELNPYDALGWIELDAGGRVRFGGSALKGFRTEPGVGTRVEVRGTTPGFAGATKAVMVVPLDPAPEAVARTPPVRSDAIAWPDFVANHPRFSDAADTRPAAALTLAPHPLFDPWRAEIERAPTVVDLAVPNYRQRDPIEPAPNVHAGRVGVARSPTRSQRCR